MKRALNDFKDYIINDINDDDEIEDPKQNIISEMNNFKK